MVLDYVSKRGRMLLTGRARCKIGGLIVLSLLGLWLTGGFLGEVREPYTGENPCLIETPQPGEPSKYHAGDTRRRTALVLAALSLGGSLVCGIMVVRTRNMPESHRWSLDQ
jgi:hypothetical protein